MGASVFFMKDQTGGMTLLMYTFIIYLQKIPLDTTYFPTQKYKVPYHATNVIFFPYHHPTFFTHLEKIQHLTAASESD